jgi:hypothetical protein
MRHYCAIAFLVAAGGFVRPARTAPSTAEAAPPPVVAKFLGLFDQLRSANAAKARGEQQQATFRLFDSEINEYMQYSLKAVPRPGLDSVTVKLFPNNYISTFTVVDFDAVERWRPGTVPAILRPLLNGKKSIWVDYRIQAKDSKLSFSVEKAYYQSIRIPAFLVGEVIHIVAAQQPEKYDTSKPVPIPFGLRRLWTSDHLIQGQN